MKSKWFARLGTIAAVVLVGVPVFAGSDTKWYPGAMCQVYAPQAVYSQILYNNNSITMGYLSNAFAPIWTGAALNQSTDADAYAICPIVRGQNVSSTAWTSLKVTALNYSTTTSLCCTARTSNPNDYQFDYKQSCVGKNTGSADWTTLQFPSAVAPASGYYFLECTIPKKVKGGYGSGIASYEVTEPAP